MGRCAAVHRFYILWIFGRCEDEYRCVGPITPGSGFKFYINDADGFFQFASHPWYGEPSYRTAQRAPGRQAGDGPGSLFSTLFAGGDPDYRVLLADRIYKAYFNEGALTPARTAAPLNVRCDELEAVFVAEAARWGYRTPADWLAVREDVSSRWLPTRTEVVLGELRAAGLYPGLDAALLNQLGGVVRAGFEVFFTDPPKGDIFFTIDGSDPRLPGGVLAPAARRYAAGALPIRPGSPLLSSIATRPVIDRNTVLKVRACEGKQWSALNETYFQTDGGALKPGEITIMELN
ncbi:MAG: hypothetical protein EXS36_08920 [Pedosphaera sp.]|nr:hypothetical protein [Pedosphaera sp.]